MIKEIVFDFDGVIVDSLDFHVKMLKEFLGKEITKEDIRKAHEGNFFSQKSIDADWKKYRNFIRSGFLMHGIPKETKDTLISLSKIYTMFIISSGSEELIKEFTCNNNLNFFNKILGFETATTKTEKFNICLGKNKSEAVFITDTLGDILEAKKENIKTIGVDFGYHDRKTLAIGNPDFIVSSFSQICEIIKKI